MRIELIGKNNNYKADLPTVIEGSYSIIEKNGNKETKVITINGKDGKWTISSDSKVKIIDLKNIKIENSEVKIIDKKNAIKKRVSLEEDSVYCICIGKSNNLFLL